MPAVAANLMSIERLLNNSTMTTPQHQKNSHQPNASGAFRVFSILFFTISVSLFLFGLFHESSEPQVLGRYSIAYTTLLAVIIAPAFLLMWVLLRPSARKIHWAGNIYALILSTVATIAIAELGLRVLNPWGIEFFHIMPYHMQGMVDHPQLGYVHPVSVSYWLGRNRVELNSHGLRDEEVPYPKPPGERRILVLGDSVTFGWGVSQGETFSDRMEPLLRARTGERWQVVNAGVNGYNSEQEAIYLQTEGMRYKPDIVLLVYVHNDVNPAFDPNATTWRRYPTWPSSLPELLNQIRTLSFLYQSTNLFTRIQREESLNGRIGQGVGSTPSIAKHPRWPSSLQALRDIANQCENARVPFLVALNSGDDPQFFAALAQLGIHAIALEPAWQRIPPNDRHVSRIDSHPSASVHSEFAKILVDSLLTQSGSNIRAKK